MPLTPPPPSLLHQAFSRSFSRFVANVTLFAFASGIGGMGIGALVGHANYQSGPTYHSCGTGLVCRDSWLQVVQFCSLANGVWMAIWCFWHGGLTLKTSDLGNVVEFTGVGALTVCACFWTVLLAHFSKNLASEKRVTTERLLPLD